MAAAPVTDYRRLAVDVGALRGMFEDSAAAGGRAGAGGSRGPSFSIKRLGLGLGRGALGDYYGVKHRTASSASGMTAAAAAAAAGDPIVEEEEEEDAAEVVEAVTVTFGEADAAPLVTVEAVPLAEAEVFAVEAAAVSAVPLAVAEVEEVPATEEVAAEPAFVVPEAAGDAGAADDDDDDEEEEEDAPGAVSLPVRAVVIFSHRPEEETELAVVAGQLVLVLDVNDAGWCLAAGPAAAGSGGNGVTVGWLPVDYVDLDVAGYFATHGGEEALREAALAAPAADAEGTAAAAAAAEASGSASHAPQRNLTAARQAVLDEVGASKLFNELRTRRAVEVTGADVDAVLAAAGGVDDARLLLRQLDGAGRRFASFDELTDALGFARQQLDIHHRALAQLIERAEPGAAAGLGSLGGGDADAAAASAWTLLREGGHGFGTADALRAAEARVAGATPPEAAASAVAALRDERGRADLDERAARSRALDFLVSPACGLLDRGARVFSVNRADVDRLFAEGRTGLSVLGSLHELHEAGRTYGTFTALVDAVTGASTPAEVERRRTSSEIVPGTAAVVAFLSSPECVLFSQASFRASAADVRRIMASRPDDPGLLLHELRALNGLPGARYESFAGVADELEGGDRLPAFRESVLAALREHAAALLAPGAGEPDEAAAAGLIRAGAGARTARLLRAMALAGDGPHASPEALASAATAHRERLWLRLEGEERDALLDALQTKPLFSAEFDIVLPDLLDAGLAGLVSVWGLTGGGLAPLLDTLCDSGAQFASLGELARALEALGRLDERFAA